MCLIQRSGIEKSDIMKKREGWMTDDASGNQSLAEGSMDPQKNIIVGSSAKSKI